MISVIVPVYNVSKYLNKCVNSIISQSYKDLEIILVDDGSTDGSSEICDEYVKVDSRVRVIHKENGGLSDARNAGINVAQGEYFVFVDSDDYIDRNMISVLYENIVKYQADIAVCDYDRVDENGNRVADSESTQSIDTIVECVEKKDINSLLYKKGHPQIDITVAWNKIYHRRLFEKLRYEIGKIHEDEFIIHRLLFECSKIVLIYSKLYYYLLRKNSISQIKSAKNMSDAIEARDARRSFYKNKGLTELENLAAADWFSSCFVSVRYARQYKIDGEKEFCNKIKAQIIKALPELKEYDFFTKKKYIRTLIWYYIPVIGELIVDLNDRRSLCQKA